MQMLHGSIMALVLDHSIYLTNQFITMPPNYAFENGRADKPRAFDTRPWRRAAQRKRWASHLSPLIFDWVTMLKLKMFRRSCRCVFRKFCHCRAERSRI